MKSALNNLKDDKDNLAEMSFDNKNLNTDYNNNNGNE